MKHLLVDLDGTLLASKKLSLHSAFIRESIRYLQKESGMGSWKSFLLLHAMRKELETPATGTLNVERAARVFADRLGLTPGEGLTLLTRMMMTIFPTLKPHFYPIPEGVAFIEWASSRFGLTLATNPIWLKEIVLLRVKWAGVPAERFGLITHAELMHSCKPSLEYYRELLEKSGIRPEDALMIGDSRKKDGPAAECGIPVFLLQNRPKAVKLGERVWGGDFNALRAFLEERRS